MAVGVLIDTFLVRSLLVPALTSLFGEAAWWPGRRLRGMSAEDDRRARRRPHRSAWDEAERDHAGTLAALGERITAARAAACSPRHLPRRAARALRARASSPSASPSTSSSRARADARATACPSEEMRELRVRGADHARGGRARRPGLRARPALRRLRRAVRPGLTPGTRTCARTGAQGSSADATGGPHHRHAHLPDVRRADAARRRADPSARAPPPC